MYITGQKILCKENEDYFFTKGKYYTIIKAFFDGNKLDRFTVGDDVDEVHILGIKYLEQKFYTTKEMRLMKLNKLDL